MDILNSTSDALYDKKNVVVLGLAGGLAEGPIGTTPTFTFKAFPFKALNRPELNTQKFGSAFAGFNYGFKVPEGYQLRIIGTEFFPIELSDSIFNQCVVGYAPIIPNQLPADRNAYTDYRAYTDTNAQLQFSYYVPTVLNRKLGRTYIHGEPFYDPDINNPCSELIIPYTVDMDLISIGFEFVGAQIDFTLDVRLIGILEKVGV